MRSSQHTQTPMGPCIAQSSLGATKRLSLRRPVKLSTTHCTYQSEIHTIQSDVHIGMLSYRLHFLLFQKVSPCSVILTAHKFNDSSGSRRYDGCPHFRVFKQQLYHTSISAILDPLCEAMTSPIIRRCPDGHLRRVIYDLVAFIADYPEQVMLMGIVQGWCPK